MPADPQYDKVHVLATPDSPYYGCHNRERPVAGAAVLLKDGYSYPFRHSTECRYDRSDTDKRCAGCIHGGRYSVNFQGV